MRRFSIITINLNNAEGLSQTIPTVLNQTYKEFEYIIIDGASTDDSVEVIRKYEDKLSYWVSEKDTGIYNAMNKGIRAARMLSNDPDKYLLFLNSGDRLYSDGVLEKISQGGNEDIVIGKIIRDDFNIPFGFYAKELTMRNVMRRGFPHQATFFAQKLFDNELYDESYKIVADWKFFVQKIIMENVTYSNIDTIVSKFDTGGISTSQHEVLVHEVKRASSELLPPRMLKDYERIAHLDDEWIVFGDALFDKVGVRKFVYSFIKMMLYISNVRLALRRKKCK